MSNENLSLAAEEAKIIAGVAKSTGFGKPELLTSKESRDATSQERDFFNSLSTPKYSEVVNPKTSLYEANVQMRGVFGDMNKAMELANSVLKEKCSEEDWKNGNFPYKVDKEASKLKQEKNLSVMLEKSGGYSK